MVEIVSKYIQLMQSVFATQERESEEQSIGNSSTGFVLHNFPRCGPVFRSSMKVALNSQVFAQFLLRSLEEAKLFERALIANISDEENRTSKLAAFESLLKGESSDSVYVSRVDATVIITAAPVSAEVLADAESRPPSALDGALAAGQESKRVSVVEKKSPEAIAKAEQYQEMLRRLELRAQLEDFWRRTSRFTKVRQVLNFTRCSSQWTYVAFVSNCCVDRPHWDASRRAGRADPLEHRRHDRRVAF